MQNRRFFLGIVLTLLFVGLLASVGWTAYNAGIAQGMVQNGTIVVPSSGAVLPNAPMYYGAFGFHRPFGFGIVGCLAPLFFFLLLFALFRFAFRPHWGGPWMRGGWDPSQGDMPERVKEWHRKLHEQESAAKAEAA